MRLGGVEGQGKRAKSCLRRDSRQRSTQGTNKKLLKLTIKGKIKRAAGQKTGLIDSKRTVTGERRSKGVGEAFSKQKNYI